MPEIDPPEDTETCAGSFRGITLSCAKALDAALAVFLESDDPAGPHKARVALRRLTTALDAFAPILRRKATADLRARAKRIFRLLGQVRDSDVLIAAPAPPSGAQVARNRSLRASVRKKLRKARMVGFTNDLRHAVAEEGLLWRRARRARTRCAEPVSQFAQGLLTAAWQLCLGYGPSVKAIPAAKLHDFRKDMKTLRYLVEFFSFSLPGLDETGLRKDFKGIQNALGVWSDYCIALRVEKRAPLRDLPPKVAEALDTAQRLWTGLVAARPAWLDQPTRRP